MILKKDLQEVFANYGFDASSYVNIKQIKIGHINSTYTLYFDQGSSVKRYLLQEINNEIAVVNDTNDSMKQNAVYRFVVFVLKPLRKIKNIILN